MAHGVETAAFVSLVAMDAAAAPTNDVPQRTFVGWLRTMPRWKKIAIAAAVAMIVVGAVWTIGSGATLSSSSGGTGSNGIATSLTSGGTTTPTSSASVDEPAAKGVFRIGFSFLAGFCLGAFVRATLRIAAIAFGFWLAMTFVLSYYGMVVVDWQAIEGVWDRFTTNVGNEWGDFQRFVTGSLPAAGLATTGLVVGLKKH